VKPREIPSTTCAQGGVGFPLGRVAQELLHHEDVKMTKRVYRRKVPTGTPLPSAIRGRGAWGRLKIGRVCQESTGLSKPKKNGSELLALTR
jgi:hypothetical protein